MSENPILDPTKNRSSALCNSALLPNLQQNMVPDFYIQLDPPSGNSIHKITGLTVSLLAASAASFVDVKR